MAASRRPDPRLGVFDTMLVDAGRVQALELHLARLATATRELYGHRLPADLEGRVRATASQLDTPHRLRIDAIPSGAELQVMIATTRVGPHSPTDAVALGPAVVPGGVGPYKWRDRRLLEQLARTGSMPLIMDTGNQLLEAASMNVWIVESGSIVTPPADGRLLPGVTRTLLLDLAHTLDLTAAEEPISLARARAAESIFLTSSIRLASSAHLADGPGPAPDEAHVNKIRAALNKTAWSCQDPQR